MTRALPVALALIALATLAPPGEGHVILEPEAVQGMLGDIARLRRESREGPTEEGRLDALYGLGQRVHGLVELLNQDVGAHGVGDLFARLVVRRLHESGIGVSFVEGSRQYVYDLAAFREYLERAPRGKRAADARYRLIAGAFYRTLRIDTPTMLRGDASELVAAVAQAEGFLRDFPNDARTKEVRLFRATDYYRLARNTRDPVAARRYEELARQALREILARHGSTTEARAAEGLLEQLGDGPGH